MTPNPIMTVFRRAIAETILRTHRVGNRLLPKRMAATLRPRFLQDDSSAGTLPALDAWPPASVPSGLPTVNSSDLRILIVPASYFARGRTVGGGERYAFEYARALAAHTPVSLALFDPTPAVETAGPLTIRTFRVHHTDERRGFPITRETWRAFRDFDVLHVMVFPTPLADLLITASRWRRQKLVLTDVGGGGPCWSTRLQRLHPRLSLNRLADGLALLSKHSASFFAGWSQPQVILYGGADLERFKPAATPPQGYALFVGRLLPHKGVLELLQSIDPQTPLRIVGRPYDDAYFDRLRQAAQGRQVTFITDADDAELLRQYAGANVVLQPSLPRADVEGDKSELLGLVALEAMACGKPVIVTRTASLPELVVDGKTGFIVEPHDRETLGRRLGELVRDPQLCQSLGLAARRHVEENFTWDRVAERGLAFYRELVGQRRAA
jgi:glycosyltransferase involved in cell wall biosynthesis